MVGYHISHAESTGVLTVVASGASRLKTPNPVLTKVSGSSSVWRAVATRAAVRRHTSRATKFAVRYMEEPIYPTATLLAGVRSLSDGCSSGGVQNSPPCDTRSRRESSF